MPIAIYSLVPPCCRGGRLKSKTGAAVTLHWWHSSARTDAAAADLLSIHDFQEPCAASFLHSEITDITAIALRSRMVFAHARDRCLSLLKMRTCCRFNPDRGRTDPGACAAALGRWGAFWGYWIE